MKTMNAINLKASYYCIVPTKDKTSNEKPLISQVKKNWSCSKLNTEIKVKTDCQRLSSNKQKKSN